MTVAGLRVKLKRPQRRRRGEAFSGPDPVLEFPDGSRLRLSDIRPTAADFRAVRSMFCRRARSGPSRPPRRRRCRARRARPRARRRRGGGRGSGGGDGDGGDGGGDSGGDSSGGDLSGSEEQVT
jgi:hypothetical protein